MWSCLSKSIAVVGCDWRDEALLCLGQPGGVVCRPAYAAQGVGRSISVITQKDSTLVLELGNTLCASRH